MRPLASQYLRFGGLAIGLALTAVFTLVAAGAAQAQSLQAERQAVIQQILTDSSGDAAAVKAGLTHIFGDLQGDEAVARAQQILDALPSGISDSDWAAVKEALSEKAGALASAASSAAIGAKLAAKESELGKTQLQAAVITDDPTDEAESSSKPYSPMNAPPQEEVICTSQSCD